MKRTKKKKKGPLPLLLLADLWSVTILYAHECVWVCVCVVMFGWAAVFAWMCVCVCVLSCILQTPPTRAEAPCGWLWGLDRCTVNPLTSESAPNGSAASAPGGISCSWCSLCSRPSLCCILMMCSSSADRRVLSVKRHCREQSGRPKIWQRTGWSFFCSANKSWMHGIYFERQTIIQLISCSCTVLPFCSCLFLYLRFSLSRAYLFQTMIHKRRWLVGGQDWEQINGPRFCDCQWNSGRRWHSSKQ